MSEGKPRRDSFRRHQSGFFGKARRRLRERRRESRDKNVALERQRVSHDMRYEVVPSEKPVGLIAFYMGLALWPALLLSFGAYVVVYHGWLHGVIFGVVVGVTATVLELTIKFGHSLALLLSVAGFAIYYRMGTGATWIFIGASVALAVLLAVWDLIASLFREEKQRRES